MLLPRSSFPSGGEQLAGLRVDAFSPDTDTSVVTPAGEADYFTVPGLRQALRAAVDAGRSRVIVDLDQLTFMDAATLGALVEARLRLSAAGGELHLRCRTRRYRRLLMVTGLDGMLDDAA